MDVRERKKVFYTRRIIFILTALVVALPLLIDINMPVAVGWPTQGLYDAIENVPEDKVVILSVNWEAGTQGETAPQTRAIMTHLARRHQRFAIFGWGFPQGPELAQKIAEDITEQYDMKYSEDWVNWGFKVGQEQMIRALPKDIHGTIKEDYFHTPVDQIPIMQDVKSHEDIGLIIDITGADTVSAYIRYVYGVYGTPIGYACTGILIPDAFPYLDAGQLKGMLRGLAGAAEYEKILGYEGAGTKGMVPQSFAHLLIIILIIIGNTGYFLKLYRDKSSRMKEVPQSSNTEERDTE